MRRFVDLNLLPPLKDLNQVKKMIRKSSILGYRSIGISLPSNVTRGVVRQLKNICDDVQTDLITRIDFAPKTPHGLRTALRRHRRRFEIVSVKCIHKSVARQAAKDKRVDLLSFPIKDPRMRFFDRSEAELASKASASLEIDMAQLLYLEGFSRIRLINSLRKEVAIAKEFQVPITFSSGATTEYLLRKPRDYVSLAVLFDMNLSSALCALSDNPLTMVERNREKLRPEYIAQGLRIIKRGNDCLNV